jgi:dTDP-4-dehydrorhamnose reductase
VTVLVTGGGGRLASALLQGLARREISALAVSHQQLDICDPHELGPYIGKLRPTVIINAAAATDVDRCELHPNWAYAVNVEGVANLAEAARRVGAHLVTVSTDYVFDGAQDHPYRETDAANPQSVYGQSKLEGERLALPESTVVRTAWLTGMTGGSVLRTALARLADGDEVRFVNDQFGSPTFCWDLAEAILDLAVDQQPGLFHVVNAGETSWWGLVRELAELAGFDPEQVQPISSAELEPPRPAARPAYSVLATEALTAAGYRPLRHYSEPLAEFVSAVR